MNAQVKWLAADLAKVDRSKTPWVVASMHRPYYVSAQNESSSVCLDCQKAFEPLLVSHNVDLVLHGHVHAYERNAPLNDYVVDPRGLDNPSSPWYIVSGAAGHYDGLDELERPLQPYSVFAQDTAYGWSKLTFHNRTHLTHEFIASRNGSVLDTAVLYKKH
jgi:3',5'-cyclic AMP phosphodiesterase CpdA